MKKLKMILPMLVFILAIGVSFAYVGTSVEKDYYATKYILVDGGWATLSVECDPQDKECMVRFSDTPHMKYRVYNSKNLNFPANGNGTTITINGLVPDAD